MIQRLCLAALFTLALSLALLTGCRRAAPATGDETIVDLQPRDGPLRAQLDAQRTKAGNRMLIVQTTATWCPPCKPLKASLKDPRVKQVLTGVRIARIDVDAFPKADIEACGLSPSSVPWFVKLDDKLRPIDGISDDEWDHRATADVPAGMAPVLDSFVKGTLTQRKSNWKVWR
jgi:thiol-disulfide isomerase/thioredoxin